MESYDPLLDCSDEDLLAQFQRGKRETFGVLVRRYERELFGYLKRTLGDGTLAQDVFQNTFLQVYKKIHMFQPGRRFKPWLYTIATHQAIDALRRNARHQLLSLDQPQDEATDGELTTLVAILESRSPGPFEHVMGEEQREQVRAAVARLPEFLRQVVILAYYQGLKYSDIAEILDIPVGTVKSRLHTALVRLHETWSAQPSLRG